MPFNKFALQRLKKRRVKRRSKFWSQSTERTRPTTPKACRITELTPLLAALNSGNQEKMEQGVRSAKTDNLKIVFDRTKKNLLFWQYSASRQAAKHDKRRSGVFVQMGNLKKDITASYPPAWKYRMDTSKRLAILKRELNERQEVLPPSL